MWMRKGRTQAGQVAGSKTNIASKKTNTEAKRALPQGTRVCSHSVFGTRYSEGGDFSYSVFGIQYSMGGGGCTGKWTGTLKCGLAH